MPADEILERLSRSPERFPGALLLTGASDAELETAALRLAASLICPADDPEGACASCRRVAAGIHPDVLSVEPEGAVPQIRIDRVRDAIVFGAGRPYEARLRVARVLRAELLGPEAGNALLKTLEEPGGQFRWILTSTRPDALLPTIRSRAATLRLPPAGAAGRRAAWERRGFTPEDAQDLAVLVGDEVVGDAVTGGAAGDPAAAIAAMLEERRLLRQTIVATLEEALGRGRLSGMVLLAEILDREAGGVELLAELLADAAVAGASADAVRHARIAGNLARLSRMAEPSAWRKAALAAAEPPPDRRRGNRRMHVEKVLLDLWGAANPESRR